MNLLEAVELVMELEPGTVLHIEVKKDPPSGVETYEVKQVDNITKGEA